MIENRMFAQLIFWGVWLVIPLIWEMIGAVAATVIIAGKNIRDRCALYENMRLHRIHRYGRVTSGNMNVSEGQDSFLPTVTIIVPVFNSGQTLDDCLQSIIGQEYPTDRLEIILVDNGSSDKSRDIFESFQEKHHEIRIWWITSEQGKSRALNMGVFSGTGRYVVNIDSDGRLDKYAIGNIVRRFEKNAGIVAMTGVVLTDPDKTPAIRNGIPGRNLSASLLQLVQQCELFEYCESFLVGRSFQSIFNSLNTLAGAFSCFRRETLIKTQLYNTETMGEDAHMTSQVREFTGGRATLCEDAFYFTQPVESLDKLYTQRQRWQRAELEIAGLFKQSHLGGMGSFIKKSDMRRLVSNHTLAFPRLIWLFAMPYLYFINYPLKLLIGANMLLYAAYVLLGILNISTACLYLKNQKKVRNYLLKNMQICLILPLYRFMLYWMRMAGIINSLTTPSKWRTRTFTEEVRGVGQEAGKEMRKRFGFMYAIKRWINGT